MQFICVVTASYTLGFLMKKNPWFVLRKKHKFSEQKVFCAFIYGKNAVHTISEYGKND